jgi:hypothetical protein
MRNFLFHRVCNEENVLWPPIPTALFEKIIRNIKKKFHVVLLEDYLSGKDQMGEGENLATISFDDGYIDNYQFAAPILWIISVLPHFILLRIVLKEMCPHGLLLLMLFF